MLQEMGVAVRELSGEFRPLNEILTDLNVKWKDMTDTEKIATAQVVAGQHKYNDFISLMNNFDMAIDSTATAMDSLGSATRENEIHVNSITGRMESLKSTTQGFWLNFIDSDMIKGGVSALQTLMTVLTKLQKTFGTFGLSVGTLFTTFMLFTKNPLSKALNTIALDVMTSSKGVKGFIPAIKALFTTSTSTATGMKGLSGALNVLGVSIDTLKLKAIALQAVLSVGIGIAITALVSGLTWLSDVAVTTKAELKEMNDEFMASANENNNLIDSVKNLINKQQELNASLDSGGLSTEDQKLKKEELLDVQRQLADLLPSSKTGFDEEGNAIADNTGKVLENLKAKKELAEREAREILAENNKKNTKVGTGGLFGAGVSVEGYGMPEEYLALITFYEDSTKKLEELREKYRLEKDDGVQKQIEKLESDMDGYNETINVLHTAIESLRNADWSEDRIAQELFPNFNKEDAVGYYNQIIAITDKLYAQTDALNQNTNAKNTNESAGTDVGGADTSSEVSETQEYETALSKLGYTADEVKIKLSELNGLSMNDQISKMAENATTAYGKAVNQAQNLRNTIDKINEAGAMTPDLVYQLSSEYPELGAKITDVASVQDFLNEKINEQVEIQSQAYQVMIGDDSNYYNEKIKNNQGFENYINESINSLVGNQNSGYNIDLSNYSSLNNLKEGVQNKFGVATGNHIDDLLNMFITAYNFDNQNFADLQSMKNGYMNALLPAIANWIASKKAPYVQKCA